MANVRLEDVTFGYGAAPVVRGVSLVASPGRLITLLGPSGCGKTTLLKLVGGYLTPLAGRIVLRDRDVTRLPPEARNAGMVFQNYALFPHLSARENVAFGLEARRIARSERDGRVSAMLDRVGVSTAERDRKPAELSGGQQQRVALARALVIEPDVLLLDEPLSNLDRHLREQLRAELRMLQQQTGVTAILVTHDQEEALAISDVIGVMKDGQVLQVGSPAEVYARPLTLYVARFLGAANLLDGNIVSRAAAVVMVRPEQCRLNPEPNACRFVWPGQAAAVTFLGADMLIDIACDNGVSLRVRTRAGTVSDRVTVGIEEESIWEIPEVSGKLGG